MKRSQFWRIMISLSPVPVRTVAAAFRTSWRLLKEWLDTDNNELQESRLEATHAWTSFLASIARFHLVLSLSLSLSPRWGNMVSWELFWESSIFSSCLSYFLLRVCRCRLFNTSLLGSLFWRLGCFCPHAHICHCWLMDAVSYCRQPCRSSTASEM